MPQVSAAASATPTVTASPSESVTPSAAVPVSSAPVATIAGARPVQLRVPRLGVTIEVAAKPCPVVKGVLDPDRSRMMVACYYVAPDRPYTLPGTATSDLSVLAGHTWRGGDAAFNALFDWKRQAFTVTLGDELWVRTEASGQSWLVYRAIALHTPRKDALADDPEVWGTAPLPGRLLTIGCVQPTDLSATSSSNAVVAWQFSGVRAG